MRTRCRGWRAIWVDGFTIRLVSRSQGAAVRPPKAKWIGEFVHESVKPLGRWDTWRATSCTLRAIRCRSICARWTVYHARGTGTGGESGAGAAVESDTRSAVDFCEGICVSAGLMDGLEGLIISYMAGVLYVSEIFQSEKQ